MFPPPPDGRRPPGFLHVDLDGLWTLGGIYGFPEGDSFENDPVFAFALPRLLDLLEHLEIPATFFIVGRDAAHPAKRRAIEGILARGHDLGNHSWSHRLDLEALPADELTREIGSTRDLLAEIAGRPPRGFRAPGYTAGPRTLTAVSASGADYDGSLLPMPWGPVLRRLARRFAARAGGGLPPPEDSPAARQYGSPVNYWMGHAPSWFTPPEGGRRLLRLPLAVSPRLRLPLHASLGVMLGVRRVVNGLFALARQGWPVTYLLHGLDLAAPEEILPALPAALRNSRAFHRPLGEKLRFLSMVLGIGLKAATRVELTADYLARTGK